MEGKSIHLSLTILKAANAYFLFEGGDHHDREDKDKTGQGQEGGEEEGRRGRADGRGEGGRDDSLPPVRDWIERRDDLHKGQILLDVALIA